MRLRLKVVPGASRAGIVGWLGSALKVRVTAPPEKGKANAAVSALLAAELGLPPAAVRIVSGGGSSNKVVEIEGASEADVLRQLGKAGD
ncbi:MAG TPA: DUF167 domain-containing protein [Woeseiaceae bacterium]|nr:DUF167 domain-containing protein [Woeseiaceae bacterium]